jgi:hypothetical protein
VEPPQTAQRRKGETIQGFTGCVQSLHEKLHECGLVLPALAIKLKIVSGICGGPYHDVFTEVYHRMCVLNDSSWQLDTITQATLVNRLTGVLHASHHWGHGKLQPGAYPKDTKGNPSARSAQLDEAPGDATCDWRGQAGLNWSQAFSILRTFKCPVVCRSVKHSLVDCPVAQKRGFKVTYSASEDTGADYRPPPCHGAGGAKRRSNTARKGRAEAAPGPSPALAPALAPVRPEGPPPAKLDKVVGFKVETPSISSSKASDSPSASDDDQFLNWGGTNEDVIHALERTQSQKTKLTPR